MFQECQIYLQPKSNFCMTYLAFLICLILGFFGVQAFATESSQATSLQNENTYFEYDKIKCHDEGSVDCYEEAKRNLIQNYKNFHYIFEDEYLLPFKLGKISYDKIDSTKAIEASVLNNIDEIKNSKLTFYNNKSETLILSIHGLWGDRLQFNKILDQIRNSSMGKVASLELTLPGHGSQNSAKYQDWIKALVDSLKIARLFAKKTIIMGQSTGGLLAAVAALKYPELIDGIILIEPALQVRSHIDVGACLSKIIPKKIIAGAAYVIGLPLSSGFEIEMGCEVQKLASLYFPLKYLPKSISPRMGTQYIQDMEVYSRVASNISVPTMVINNESDNVVSSSANRYFYKGLVVPKQYLSINEDGNLHHGVFTYLPHASISIESFLNTNHLLRHSFTKVKERKLFKAIDRFEAFNMKELCAILEDDTEFNCDQFSSFYENIIKFNTTIKFSTSDLKQLSDYKSQHPNESFISAVIYNFGNETIRFQFRYMYHFVEKYKALNKLEESN